MKYCKLSVFVVQLIAGAFFYKAAASSIHSDLEETPLGFYHTQLPHSIRPVEPVSVDEYYYLDASKITPAKNQGPLGTCVSFAISACAEYWFGRLFSETEFTILAQTHRFLGNGCKGGVYLGNGAHVSCQYGLMEDEDAMKRGITYDQFLKKVREKNRIYQDEDLEEAQICSFDKNNDSIENYNKTMQEFGFDVKLSGQDSTNFLLNNIYVIHHVTKDSIAQAISARMHSPRFIRGYHTGRQLQYSSAPRGSFRARPSQEEDLTSNMARLRLSSIYETTYVSASPSSYSSFSNRVYARDLGEITQRNRSRLSGSNASSSSDEHSSIGIPYEADIQSIQNALSRGFPVLAALNVYGDNWNQENLGQDMNNGSYYVKMLENPEHFDAKDIASHAIVIIGYNASKEFFWIKNSWGKKWGNAGFAYLPYDYVRRYATELIAIAEPITTARGA